MFQFIKKTRLYRLRHQIVPNRYFFQKYGFEPEILKNERSQAYEPSDIYPTFYKNNMYNLRNRLLAKNSRFDANGYPMNLFGNTYIYNPVTIAQLGLMYYGFHYDSGQDEYYTSMVKLGEWLLSNVQHGKLLYKADYEIVDMGLRLKAPWASAMAQGQSLSLWTRLYLLTGDKVWLSKCDAIVDCIIRPTSQGGLAAEYHGYPFYEEYPTTPPTFVLNGFMFCLIGLYDYATVGTNERAKLAFNTGFRTLQHMLPLYDTGSISCYHLGHLTSPPRAHRVSLMYHIIHIKLLEAINSISRSEMLTFYIRLWKTW